MLRRPNVSKSFLLHTDWSSLDLGAVLIHIDDLSQGYVVAYVLLSNNTVEANYSSYEGGALATVWAITHFWPYLYDRRFTLMIDHQPLQWLMESNKLTDKLVMWALSLHEYDFEVMHRIGITNLDANGF